MYQVLIAEDDPMVAMINSQYVARNKQFQVAGVSTDGESTLEFLARTPVDLVILDVFMPRVDGLETLRRIRAQKLPVEVIMVTAANDRTSLEQAIRLGALDYLVKPFAFDRFQIALDKFAAQAEALRDMEVFNQKRIDLIIDTTHRKNDELLPKGINDKTLTTILECLETSADRWSSGEAIASKVGLSVVTVRRYLNHLTQTGLVCADINYETGGRPCMLYRLEPGRRRL